MCLVNEKDEKRKKKYAENIKVGRVDCLPISNQLRCIDVGEKLWKMGEFDFYHRFSAL